MLIMVPACLTIYLSADYIAQWPLLRVVGAMKGTQIILYLVGQALENLSAAFRAWEQAAWHAKTSIAFIMTGTRGPWVPRVGA